MREIRASVVSGVRAVRAIAFIALLAAGCGPSGPSLEVWTHCGLDWARVEYDGRMWRFEGAEGQHNNPPGWGDPRDTIVVLEIEGDRMVAAGPDGKQWILTVTEQVPDRGCF